MNRYEKYSNSELTWSETIPEHWDVKRIARVFDIRKEKKFPYKNKRDSISKCQIRCFFIL